MPPMILPSSPNDSSPSQPPDPSPRERYRPPSQSPVPRQRPCAPCHNGNPLVTLAIGGTVMVLMLGLLGYGGYTHYRGINLAGPGGSKIETDIEVLKEKVDQLYTYRTSLDQLRTDHESRLRVLEDRSARGEYISITILVGIIGLVGNTIYGAAVAARKRED